MLSSVRIRTHLLVEFRRKSSLVRLPPISIAIPVVSRATDHLYCHSRLKFVGYSSYCTGCLVLNIIFSVPNNSLLAWRELNRKVLVCANAVPWEITSKMRENIQRIYCRWRNLRERKFTSLKNYGPFWIWHCLIEKMI